MKDTQGRYLMMNTAGARLLGKSVDEVIGKNDAELFTPETARQISEVDDEIAAAGATRTFEGVATSAGVTRTYLTTKGLHRDDQGHVLGVIGISRDITESKRTAESLRQTQEFLSRLLDHAPALIFVTTGDGHARLVNRAWEETFGLQREDVIGRSLEQVCPPDLARRFRDQNQRVIETSAPITLEEEVEVRDGRRDLFTIKFPLRDTANQIEAVGGISFDITERKRTEKALEESRRRLQVLFDNTTDAIWLLDDLGQFVDANPAVCAARIQP